MGAVIPLQEDLLSLLSCPVCGSDELRPVAAQSPRMHLVAGSEQVAWELRCEECASEFPVTDDGIPVFCEHALDEFSVGSSSLTANAQLYEQIYSDYDSCTRKSETIRAKVRCVASEAQKRSGPAGRLSDRWHLDFGCGPGHVLDWLSDYGMRQVGLDVSLANLRLARRKTGALVVQGDAARMPFGSGVFSLITESSALHHIGPWREALAEACRCAAPSSAVVLDSEPSVEQLAWSRAAIAIYGLRLPVYHMLSSVLPTKYAYRDLDLAKRQIEAEVHNSPGRGFIRADLSAAFEQAGFDAIVFLSPGTDLAPHPSVTWQAAVLNVLSARNPWNPRYGSITVLALR